MSSGPTTQHRYTIKEVAALTGLPASTLRYYESVGVVAPIDRGQSSKQRVYSEDDLDNLIWVACLSATGMSISDMRRYLANSSMGPKTALQQVELLQAQEHRLEDEAQRIAVRQRYVRLKIEYWRAVAAGDEAEVERLSTAARVLADELQSHRN